MISSGVVLGWGSSANGKWLSYLLVLAASILPIFLPAQSKIVLDQCGVSYTDPQDAGDADGESKDTLIYQTFFDEKDNSMLAYHVDINAFGGQQTDRTSVYAIMPDSSLALLGSLAFGSCVDCAKGFALMHDGTLLVDQVDSRERMDQWVQSLNQPSFTLTGNLQTLVGAGRISGRLPFCSIGLYVEFIVNSNPASTTTEFSTHILCPLPVADCSIEKSAEVDCAKDSVFLTATLPPGCFSASAKAGWLMEGGLVTSSPNAAFPLRPDQSVYYLVVEETDCRIVDSIVIDNPSFADAGSDQALCRESTLTLKGRGGIDHQWEFPDGSRKEDSLIVIENIQPAQAGIFVLHAWNEGGCEDTDSLYLEVINPPEPVVSVSNACLGDTIFLQVSNDTAFVDLSWKSPQGTPLATPYIPDFQVSNAGTYSVVGKDSAGCTAEMAFPVSGSEPPAFEYLVEESCDSTNVEVFPDTYAYQWENGTQGRFFSTATGGTYQLVVTDSVGCASSTAIELPAPDGPDYILDVEQPPCPNDFGSVEVLVEDSNRPVIFSIDNGMTYSVSPRFEELSAGRYTVLVQDELGCTKEKEVEILAPDTLGVSLEEDYLQVRPTTPVALSAETVGDVREIQWLPDQIDTGKPYTDFVANTDMDIRVIVRDDRGCIASDGLPLSIVLGEVYVPNAFSPNGDGANDRFTLYSDLGSGEIIESLMIFDRWGNLVFETHEVNLNDESEGWDGIDAGKPVSAGVLSYYGVVRFGNGVRKVYKGDVTLMR